MSGGSVSDGRAGFFGKLPSHGDFIARGLPPGFLRPFDDWLQAGLARSRLDLGEAWVEHWLTSPVWHFALAPGLCGEDAAMGVMIPSVDRVGRYFPFAIVGLSRHARAVFEGGPVQAAWHETMAGMALAALERGADPDALAAVIADHPLPPEAPPPPLGDGCVVPDELDGIDLLLARSAPALGLWWTPGGAEMPPVRLAFKGLPSPAAFSGLLKGDPAAAFAGRVA